MNVKMHYERHYKSSNMKAAQSKVIFKKFSRTEKISIRPLLPSEIEYVYSL